MYIFLHFVLHVMTFTENFVNPPEHPDQNKWQGIKTIVHLLFNSRVS